jgi:hypothetical protein
MSPGREGVKPRNYPRPKFWKNIEIYIHIYEILMPQIIVFKNDSLTYPRVKIKVNISLLQAVEAPRVARGRGSHIT